MNMDIKSRRKIIHRAALQDQADAIASGEGSEVARRQSLLKLYKSVLEKGRTEVERRFFEDGDGALCVAGNAFLMDQLIRVIHDVIATRFYPNPNPTDEEKLSIVAVGGYGRGELAPFSDIDLLFLHSYKKNPRIEQVVEAILYTLWDLGLKVGHSTRSVDETLRQAKGDITIRTAVLESRFLWGDRKLAGELAKRFQDEIVRGTGHDFVQAKLKERDERHERLGGSRYVLEPNIKDGKGGLRDLQTLYWTAKYRYQVLDVAELVEKGVQTKEEFETFDRAQRHFWTLRCHLHYLTGRAEERLSFDVQPELARRMGYTDHAGAAAVERFMKHYFLVAKEVGDLTRIFCAGFELADRKTPLLSFAKLARRKLVDGFVLDGGRLNLVSADQFARTPVDMLRIFDVMQTTGQDIHPDALKAIHRNLKRITRTVQNDPVANRHFLNVLAARRDPENTLRRMNECGVFGKFVPDFGRVVAQMQYDMYHVYTTDEHTIRALGILSRIENGQLKEDHPLASEMIHSIQSREALYVAVLLHDIAKGRGGDHSELGAKVALKLCPRFGLTPEETETVSWLVLHHLAMSDCAQKRDLDDPQTIRDFVALVQSPERLKLLLCLTVVDIRAVGPKVWNNWKATLLRDLYRRAEEMMVGAFKEHGSERRIAAEHSWLAAALTDQGWTEEDVRAHQDRLSDSYLLSVDRPTLLRHAEFVRQAERDSSPLALDTAIDQASGASVITVYTDDHPGLFSRIAGALAMAGATVVEARIATLKNGRALDSFQVQDTAEGGAFQRPDKLARLSVLIEQALSGRLKAAEELRKRGTQIPKRTRVFKVPARVVIDNTASSTATVVEVNGRDRPAFLYDVTRALSECGLQIGSAKISTFGEQAIDVFYVRDVFGMKVDHQAKLKQIRERVAAAIANPDCEPASPSTGQAMKETPKPVRRRRLRPSLSEAAE